MLQNGYITVKEISLKYDMSARNVRRIISKLSENCSEATLYKYKNHEWQLRHLLIPKFKHQRNKNINKISWHMLSATFDRQKDVVKIYQDGQYIGSLYVNDSFSYTPTW